MSYKESMNEFSELCHVVTDRDMDLENELDIMVQVKGYSDAIPCSIEAFTYYMEEYYNPNVTYLVSRLKK